ncbi:hypothetical protein LOZ80_10595 [Paenibacillus sp. HWE-109]|uniref:hypothetical protein n=1 Tax=Paenibacillus sp. HWE-109 TaxID=1306526 RepID=UPI001EDD5105|nr:hypothetical protein [Paenibacillus sp. HWE-109]UKS29346.1 hypothetical protein LOZ80_10595 [Paenibacillus sp. HWE-109]
MTVGTGFLNKHKANVSLSERKEYYDHGRLLFSIAPQPNARAGEGSDKIIDVFSSNPLAGELNGSDRHAPTMMMMMPEVGRWRLLPYVHGRLLDPIVVEVR